MVAGTVRSVLMGCAVATEFDYELLDAALRESAHAHSVARLRGVLMDAAGMDEVLVVNTGAIAAAAARCGPDPCAILEDVASAQGLAGWADGHAGKNPSQWLRKWVREGCSRWSRAWAVDGVVLVNDNCLFGMPSWQQSLLCVPGRDWMRLSADWVLLHEAGHVREYRSGASLTNDDLRLMPSRSRADMKARRAVRDHAGECYADAHATLGLVRGGVPLALAAMVHALCEVKTLKASRYADEWTSHGIYNTFGVLDRILRMASRDGFASSLRTDLRGVSLHAARRGAFPVDVLARSYRSSVPEMPDWFGDLSSHPMAMSALTASTAGRDGHPVVGVGWLLGHPWVMAARNPLDAFHRMELAQQYDADFGVTLDRTAGLNEACTDMGVKAGEWLLGRCGLGRCGLGG